MRFLRNLRASRSPSWPFLFVKVEFWKICYSCYFCHICYSIFSHSKKNSSYFCDFCDICYFFYTFLIAVFFKSFLLKLRKQFASKIFANKIDPGHKWSFNRIWLFSSLDLNSPNSVCALFLKKLFIFVGKPPPLYDFKFSPKKKAKDVLMCLAHTNPSVAWYQTGVCHQGTGP